VARPDQVAVGAKHVERSQGLTLILERLSVLANHRALAPYLFLAPAIGVLLLTGIAPLVFLIYASFHDYNLNLPTLGHPFIGLQNYIDELRDPLLSSALLVTLKFGVMALPPEILFGIAIALLLHRRSRFPLLQKVTRVTLIIPLMCTPAVTGLMWNLMLNSQFGVLNWLTAQIGLPVPPWLGSQTWALFAIVMVDVWMWTPFVTLVGLASLATVPQEQYEAAVLEGAGNWQIFRHILLPFMVPGLTAVLIIRTADIIRNFDAIYTLTQGGPGTATQTLSVLIQRTAFKIFDLGHAAVMGIFGLLIAIVLSQLYIKLFYREIEYT
jgi:multiple sugar transport system permease protein